MKSKKKSRHNNNWLSQVILDVLVTALVILSTFWMPPVLRYLLYGYSGLLLIVRLLTLFSKGFGSLMNMGKGAASVPDWFYHLNYFICTAIFFFSMEYILGIMWALIWLLSWIAFHKSSKSVANSEKG